MKVLEILIEILEILISVLNIYIIPTKIDSVILNKVTIYKGK